MVSNFNKNLKDFISSSGLSLLVPATIIGRGGWFVSAMFIARIIYWWIHNFVKKDKVRFSFFLTMALISCYLYRYANLLNASFILHAMVLAVYFFVGHNYSRLTNIQKIFLSVAYLVITIIYFEKRIIPPHITNVFDVSIINYPLHFLMSVGGSIFLIELSKFIRSNRIIEYLGRNSLVIYLTHIVIIQAIFPKIPKDYLYQEDNITMSIIVLMISFCFVTITSVSIASIFRLKPLKWIIGVYK